MKSTLLIFQHRQTPAIPEELKSSDVNTITESHFIPNATVKILCHGLAQNYLVPIFPQKLKNGK